MACQAVQRWSLSGLVAAFVDLAIAYLLLCASAVAYLASKFLGFFRLNLPCPCDGMFINVYSNSFCLDRLLIDFPTQKVSDVQISVKKKFPFSDYNYPKTYDCSIESDTCAKGILELEGEASCSSVSDARRSVDVVRREISSRIGKYNVKWKEGSSHKPRSRLRLRKRGGDPPLPEEVLGGESYSHFSTKKKGNGFIEDDFKAPKKLRGRAVTSVEMNQSTDEDMQINRTIQCIEELQDNGQEIHSFDGEEKNTVRLLEQKLEEERVALGALYSELEKERSASATAADEAMAMILRLQEEKASIEMEARQYQRILEEKSAYDAEEMDILKEIIIRREMEKHFLEKEVEAYRQMVSVGNEQLAGDGSDNSHLNGDPVLILHKLCESADKKVTIERKCLDSLVSMDKSNHTSAFGMESSLQCHGEESSFEQHNESNENSVKEIIFADKNIQMTSKAPLESQKNIPLQTVEQVEEMNRGQKLAEKIIETCNGNETGDKNYDPRFKQHEKDALLKSSSSCDPMLDKDTRVYDVHIIRDGTCFHHEAAEGKRSSLKLHDRNFAPSSSCLETEAGLKRSSSEITRGLPPIGPRGFSMVSDLRRSSTSAMDSEMLKIDCEIGQLRERLKVVQEGREKLGLSFENRERENLQLKLLEDIARQVQEIRSMAVPGKAERQVSLPLPTSKVLSKKRRSRSVSLGPQISSEG